MSYGPNSTFSSGYISYVLYGCPLCRLHVVVGSITVGVLWAGLAPRPAGFQTLLQVEAASLWVQSGLDYMVQRVPRPGPAHWYVELDWGTWLQGSGDPGLVLPLWRLGQ